MLDSLKVRAVAAIVTLASGSALQAAYISYEGAALPFNTGIIAQQTTDTAGGLDGSQDFTDNGGPPGQTFLATSDGTLGAITVKGGGNAGSDSGFKIQIGSVNTTTGQITQSEVESFNTPSANNDYFTISLANPVAITAGTTYEYSILTTNGYYGLAHSTGTTDAYADGTAFNNDANTTDAGNTSPARTFNGFVSARGYDYVFVASVPEPASLSVLALGSLGLLSRRRRGA